MPSSSILSQTWMCGVIFFSLTSQLRNLPVPQVMSAASRFNLRPKQMSVRSSIVLVAATLSYVRAGVASTSIITALSTHRSSSLIFNQPSELRFLASHNAFIDAIDPNQ